MMQWARSRKKPLTSNAEVSATPAVRSWLGTGRVSSGCLKRVALETVNFRSRPVQFVMDQFQVRIIPGLVPSVDRIGSEIGNLHKPRHFGVKEERSFYEVCHDSPLCSA